MGTMTLDEFKAELVVALKNRQDTAANSTRQALWINQVYSHVSQPEVYRHKGVELAVEFPLITGQVEYDLETLYTIQINSVRDITYYSATASGPTVSRRDLKPRSIQNLNRRTSASGPPSTYALEGKDIVLGSVPTANENGHIVSALICFEPTPLSAGGSTTVLGTYWDQVILLGAQWKAEWQLGYRDLALMTKQEYVSMINEKRVGSHELNTEDTDFFTEIESPSIMTGSF